MKVAIQGEAGSFSYEAAKRMARGCSIVACARSREVFDRLERGLVNAAVIPIENSLAGSVVEHFDLLLAQNVSIQQEYRLRIVHNLIASPRVKMGDIRRVSRIRWRSTNAGIFSGSIRRLKRCRFTTRLAV